MAGVPAARHALRLLQAMARRPAPVAAAALARELALPYAAIAVVANFAAGRAGSSAGIRMEEINATLQLAHTKVRRIIEQLVVLHGG